MRTRNLILPVLALLLGACQSTSEVQQRTASRAQLAEVNTELGFQYMQKGEYEVALQKLNKALDADADYVAAHNALGVLHSTLGQHADAERSFRRALQLEPTNSSALNNYGQFLCQRGRHTEGQAQFLKAVENPLYRVPAVAYSNAGSCALDAGDLDGAETHFRQALELDPRLAPALLQMADISYRQGLYLPARGYLQRYQAVARPSARALWLGIRIERELGDKDALASYSLQLAKNFPDPQQTNQYYESKQP